MAYASAEALLALLAPDPTDPAGTPGELDPAVLDARIATAAAQVDAALAARYLVPFTDPVPALVVDITLGIAGWLAALTYRRSVDITGTDPLQLRYQWATDQLAALAKGDADLPDAPTGGDGPTRAGAATTIQPYDGELFALDTFGLTNRRGRIDAEPFWW